MIDNKIMEHSTDENINLERTKIIVVSNLGKLIETDIVTNTVTSINELTQILSSACGNKRPCTFSCYHTWRYRNKNNRFGLDEEHSEKKYVYIDLWAKTDGRAGEENKYELPPPVDEIIFFGKIALVARVNNEVACNLSVKKWKIIYERLFGGFEGLALTAEADENEIDELALIPASKKTKNGYLKDGFVVDDDETSSGSSCKLKNKSKSSCISKSDTKKNNDNKNRSKTRFIGHGSSDESEFVTETETEETSTGTVTGTETGTEENEVDSECNTPTPHGKNININIKIKMPVNKVKNTKSKSTKNKKIIDDDEDEDELVEDKYDSV